MRTKKILNTFATITLSVISTYFLLGIPASTQGTSPQTNAVLQYQVGGTLYMQKAAEYRSLAYQAFNIARLRFDATLEKKNVKKLPKAERKMPRAIVVDIDETILDNSPAQAYSIANNAPFNLKDWYAWGDIFYVSNRDGVQKPATIDNLKKVGLTDIADDNVILRASESGKEARRTAIAKTFRIVMLMGDNLDDFSNVFEKKSIADRFAETDKARDQFGDRFIVLPNAMYGTWENAIYDYGRLTEAQKAEKRAAALELP
ncbi:MAG: 5'-nucleotidase, lipoprotein e(P4) family [Chloracidobacterium sp.]|nr:5'-nucleotidase, lipoprotein e(P4) family [Chloracidobacterium sp.]